ncbi:MAG: thioredoxin family protein [Acidimicrobiia bacterium]
MAVESTMVELGTPAPDFELSDLTGTRHRLSDHAGSPALVMFLCNHCPYVKHVERPLAELVAEYEERGVVAFGVMSNDADRSPDDSPADLADQAERAGFSFPYLIDVDQSVGRAYRAACTPDFFVYDADHRLAYRGRMDAATPGNDQPNDGAELRAALDAVLAGEPAPEPQRPPMGCSIKWREA